MTCTVNSLEENVKEILNENKKILEEIFSYKKNLEKQIDFIKKLSNKKLEKEIYTYFPVGNGKGYCYLTTFRNGIWNWYNFFRIRKSFFTSKTIIDVYMFDGWSYTYGDDVDNAKKDKLDICELTNQDLKNIKRALYTLEERINKILSNYIN